jgi:hypothetical protein
MLAGIGWRRRLITRALLQVEIDETKKDLEAFSVAREHIRKRHLEVQDYPVQRLLPDITNWSGTDAVIGSLDLVVHALERTLTELKDEYEKAPPDEPKLRLVENK